MKTYYIFYTGIGQSHHLNLISVAKHCLESCLCLNDQEENKNLVTYFAGFISLSSLSSQDLQPVDANRSMFQDLFLRK